MKRLFFLYRSIKYLLVLAFRNEPAYRKLDRFDIYNFFKYDLLYTFTPFRHINGKLFLVRKKGKYVYKDYLIEGYIGKI